MKPAQKSRGGARPGAGAKPYQPTAVIRQDVRLHKAEGWSDDRIAALIGISRTTLLKHFPRELAYGADQEHRAMIRLLKRQANKGSVPAIRELLKRIEAGSAIDQFLQQPEAPAPQPEKPRRLGKKEQQIEEARTAHVDTEWADDLPPLPERMH